MTGPWTVTESWTVTGRVRAAVIGGGSICHAPDGCPLPGPVEGHEGLWVASTSAMGAKTGATTVSSGYRTGRTPPRRPRP